MSNISGTELVEWLALIGLIVGFVIFLMRDFLFRAFFSLLGRLMSNQVGRIILGILLLAGGFLIVATSHGPFAYQHLAQENLNYLQNTVNASGDGNIYLLDSSKPGTYYIIHETDFSPPVHAYMFLLNGGFTSLVYNANDSREVSFDGIDIGTGYSVEQFTLLDFLRLSSYSFTSITYQENPNGPIQNNWLIGGGIAIIGLFMLLLTPGLSLLRKNRAKASASIVAPGMYPYNPYLAPGTAPPPGSPPVPYSVPGIMAPPGSSSAAMPQNPYVQPPVTSEDDS